LHTSARLALRHYSGNNRSSQGRGVYQEVESADWWRQRCFDGHFYNKDLTKKWPKCKKKFDEANKYRWVGDWTLHPCQPQR
jgi:hypothetical protein